MPLHRKRKGSFFFYLFSPIILEAKAIGNCPLIFHFDRNSVWHLRQQTKKEFHLHFSVIFCPPRARISFGFSSGSGLSVASSAPNTHLMKWPGALLTRLKKMPDWVIQHKLNKTGNTNGSMTRTGQDARRPCKSSLSEKDERVFADKNEKWMRVTVHWRGFTVTDYKITNN